MQSKKDWKGLDQMHQIKGLSIKMSPLDGGGGKEGMEAGKKVA